MIQTGTFWPASSISTTAAAVSCRVNVLCAPCCSLLQWSLLESPCAADLNTRRLSRPWRTQSQQQVRHLRPLKNICQTISPDATNSNLNHGAVDHPEVLGEYVYRGSGQCHPYPSEPCHSRKYACCANGSESAYWQTNQAQGSREQPLGSKEDQTFIYGC